MSTPAQIRAAWKTSVWDNQTAKNITEKIYDYDVTQDSQTEIERFFFRDPEDITTDLINFFTYLTRRNVETIGLCSQVRYNHIVEVHYYLEAKPDGSSYNQLIDAMVSIEDLVESQLDKTWSDTVDFYELDAVEKPEVIELANRPSVWHGVQIYNASEITIL